MLALLGTVEQATVVMVASLAAGRVFARGCQPDQLPQLGGELGLNHRIPDHLAARHRSYRAAGAGYRQALRRSAAMDTEARATTIGITYDLTCTASSWGPGGQHETSPMSAYTDACLVEQHGMAVLLPFLESRAWRGPSDPCCQGSVGEALPAQLWRPAHRHRAGQRGQRRDQGTAPGGRAICIWRCGATRTWTTGARLVASLTDHFLHIGGIKVCARQHLRLENAPICFYLLIRRTLLRRFLRSPRGRFGFFHSAS